MQRAGQYREALPLALQALQSRYQEQGPEHPDTAAALTSAGLLYLELASLDEALPLLQRALQIRFKVLGVSHPDTAASLMHLGEVYRRQGSLEEARPLLERALQVRQQVLGPEQPETAASLTALALYYEDKGEEGKVLPLLLQALAIRERVLGYNSSDLAASLNLVGDHYRRRGAYQQALPLLEKSLQIQERTLGRLHPATAQSLSSLGQLYSDMGFYSKAQTALEQALQVRQKALGLEHPLAVQSLSDLGLLYARQKEIEKAKPLLERALAIRERQRPAEHPDLAASYHDLAVLQQAMGRLESAVALAQRSLQIREQVLGPGHIDTLASLGTLAGLYRQLGAPAKAVPLYSRILQAREKVLGADHPDLIDALAILAQTQREAGQPDQTLAGWQRIWQIREKALGAEHPDTLASLTTLAALALDLGLYTKALAWYQKILKFSEKNPGPEQPPTAVALTNVARVYQAMGEFDLALPLLERARQIQERVWGADHLEVARTSLDLALLRQAREEYDQALLLYHKAIQIREKVLGAAHPETARALAQLADCYTAMGWYAAALAAYEQARAALTKAVESSPRDLGQILVRLATLLETMGETGKAVPLWQRAVEGAESSRSPDQADIDRLLANLGFGYLEAGEIKKAEVTFDRLKTLVIQVEVALALGRAAEAWDLMAQASPPLVSSPAFQVGWLTQQGRALAGVGMLPEAAVALWEALSGGAKLAPRGPQQQLGQSFWWQSRVPQEHLLTVLLRLDAQGAPLPPQLQELGDTPRTAAFALAALAKGQNFLAALARAPGAPSQAELPPELRLRLLSLQRRLAANEVQWERAVRGGSEALQEAIAGREKLMGELAEIRGELALSQPLAAALYFPQPQALAHLPLAADEVLFEYVLGYAESFVMVVRPGAIPFVYAIPAGRTALAGKIQELLAPVLQAGNAAWPLATAQELYELLLAKPLATVAPWERLIIVPDGVLGLLPFEALVSPAGRESKDTVFVGEQRSLVYYPSTAVLAQQRGRPTEPKPRSYLGVGPPWPGVSPATPAAEKALGHGERRFLAPLSWTTAGYRALAAHQDWGPLTPGDRQEQWLLYPYRPESELILRELAALLQKDGASVDLLLGPQATAANLRRLRLADYRWLQVASFTDFSDAIQGLRQPFLLLGREENAPASSGPLTLSDLLALPLGAHMVVLDTGIIGRGQALAGAGVSHLTRALMYAGARSVLVNLWPLPPAVCREFSQQLFTLLQDGQRPGQAVSQARKELRRRHPDPKIWAAYQFWGEE
uniref:tetratricopeptide repeat protein n=1 Tax=Desulfobacca sp. TaxID=2067990 RepID=UPI00404AAE21